jgi:hypothetical protein
MNIHLNTRSPWLLGAILASGLIAVTGHITNSFGFGVGVTFPSSWESVELMPLFDFTVDECSYSGDIHKATVKYTLVSKEEHQGKVARVFLMFKLREKPEEMWFYNEDLERWIRYDEIITRLPADYAYEYIVYNPNHIGVSTLSTGRPVDLSNLPGVGELWGGYGLAKAGYDPFYAPYMEMQQAQRFRLIWDSIEGCTASSELEFRIGSGYFGSGSVQRKTESPYPLGL